MKDIGRDIFLADGRAAMGLTLIVRFRICAAEPLLGKIDLIPYVNNLGWIIAGSETGKEVRQLDRDWVRDLRDCAGEESVPFFIKQMGSSHRDQLRSLDGREWNDFPQGFVK